VGNESPFARSTGESPFNAPAPVTDNSPYSTESSYRSPSPSAPAETTGFARTGSRYGGDSPFLGAGAGEARVDETRIDTNLKVDVARLDEARAEEPRDETRIDEFRLEDLAADTDRSDRTDEDQDKADAGTAKATDDTVKLAAADKADDAEVTTRASKDKM
jgi:hypothetical protein